MIEITKAEEKMLRKVVPSAHIRSTTHKLCVDETRAVLEALTNNEAAKAALAELNYDAKLRSQHSKE